MAKVEVAGLRAAVFPRSVAQGRLIVVTGHFKTSQPGSNQNQPL
jgi:hypothetical protein